MRWLAVLVLLYVCIYCYWLALVLLRSRAVGLLFLVPLVPCRLALLSVAVAICFNRAVMRCNRFYVFGGVVLPCALSCDSGAFYKRLPCVWLVACAGLRVGLCWLVGTACACPRVCDSFCWLLSAVGVRMARIGFIYADIYLYTVAVGAVCGAFSRSCGGLVRLWLVVCVIAWFVLCGVTVSMYIGIEI